MASATLDTQTLTPGDVVTIDKKIDAVFVGEMPRGCRYFPESVSDDVYVFLLGDKRVKNESVGEIVICRGKVTISEQNICTNNEGCGIRFHYPEHPSGTQNDLYFSYLNLLKWAGLRK